MSALRVTPRQRRALDAIEKVEPFGLSPAALGEALGTSSHGASRTAASLVNRHLLRRIREKGRTIYILGEVDR